MDTYQAACQVVAERYAITRLHQRAHRQWERAILRAFERAELHKTVGEIQARVKRPEFGNEAIQAEVIEIASRYNR